MKINVIDIETMVDENKKLKPFCICYSINKELRVIYGLDCVSKFIDEIMEKREINFYAHNLTFDGSFILKELVNKKIEFKLLLIKNRIYCIRIIKNNIYMKCSFNLFPYSLAKGEKILNCIKKTEFDHRQSNISNIFKDDFIKKIKEYCENDVKVLIDLIDKYNKALKNIYPRWYEKNSISSITLKIFENKYNEYKIKTNLKYKEDILFRKGYFGGRCEIFGNPEDGEKIYHFDFKGMYSQIMKEEFPTGEYKYSKEKKIEKIGFYYVKVISNMDIPVLPFRSEDGKLMFPNGEFWGLYWYEEIKYFIKRGGIVKEILYAYVFNDKKKTFNSFTSKMSELREVNDQNKFIFKLINNSLYGRMGMSAHDEKTIYTDEIGFKKIERTKDVIKYSKINDAYIVTIKEEVNEKVSINSNVIYASIITSKARIKLHKGFISVIESGGRVLYCDTDSIFSSYKRNVDNEKHGEIFWDISKNDTEIKDAVFAMPKMYAVRYKNNKDKITMKGLKKPDIKFEEFKDKFYSNECVIFKEEQLTNKNFEFNESNIIKLISFEKKYYTKRKFTDDLKRTDPITIKSTEER